MDPREARAAERRRTWTGGVAKSFAEMERIDLEYWLAMSPEERLGCVFDLWNEQTNEEGDHEAAGRLQRDIGGVRPRRG